MGRLRSRGLGNENGGYGGGSGGHTAPPPPPPPPSNYYLPPSYTSSVIHHPAPAAPPHPAHLLQHQQHPHQQQQQQETIWYVPTKKKMISGTKKERVSTQQHAGVECTMIDSISPAEWSLCRSYIKELPHPAGLITIQHLQHHQRPISADPPLPHDGLINAQYNVVVDEHNNFNYRPSIVPYVACRAA